MADSAIQELVCCLGQSVGGKPTQFIMERAFAAASLDWRYVTLEVSPENLADAVRGVRAMGFRGGNFTTPHQIAAVPLLDELGESARLVGAVNCFRREGERLIGESTEGQGLVQALRGVLDPAGQKAVVLGAGCTAQAIAVELGLAGVAEIIVVNRTAERGQSLVDLLQERVKVAARLVHLSGDYSVEEGTRIVVNATPIGCGDAEARVPLNIESLTAEMVVADVSFDPPQTRLIREAGERGCQTLDGLGLLVRQAAIDCRLWTGVDPDPAVMREALEEYLEI